MSIHLDDYHAAVIAYLSDALPWLRSVEEYPDVFDQLVTPCAFFGVLDWDRSDEQRMTGELSVVLSCQLILVFGDQGAVAHKAVRNAAMSGALKVDGARFGLPVAPAEFISAAPYSFEPDLYQYAVWSIDFKHLVDIGVDDFAAMADFLPSAVNTGKTPDIGVEKLDAYEQVVS